MTYINTVGNGVASNLYSDFREFPELDAEAQAKYNQYIAMLRQISEACHESDSDEPAYRIFEAQMKALVRVIVSDAFQEAGVEIPDGMELHVTGSLAKGQATEFSDLDAYLLFRRPADAAAVKPIMRNIYFLMARINRDTNQMMMDPVELTPLKIAGTVDEVFALLQEAPFLNPDAVNRSLVSSCNLFGDEPLGRELKRRIKADPRMSRDVSMRACYRKAISEEFMPRDFTGSSSQVKGKEKCEETANIKKHLLRPIDFILMGLREELGYTSKCGDHLSAQATFRWLRAHQYLPEAEIKLMEDVFTQAMAARFEMHSAHQGEYDNVPRESVEELLVKVERLRGIFAKRLESIELAKARQAEANQRSRTSLFSFIGWRRAQSNAPREVAKSLPILTASSA